MSCLARDPDARPTTARILGKRLADCLAAIDGVTASVYQMRGHSDTSVIGRSGRWQRLKRPVLVGATIAALVVLAAGAGALFVNPRHGARQVAVTADPAPFTTPVVALPHAGISRTPVVVGQQLEARREARPATPPPTRVRSPAVETRRPQPAARAALPITAVLSKADVSPVAAPPPPPREPGTDGSEAEHLLVESEAALQQGQIRRATEAARKAIAAGGGAPAHLALGKIYFNLERWNEAIAAFNETLKLDPANDRALRGRAEAEAELRAKK
jgi:cytochrome c-type biogenesis protein CcmH/NrfG